MEYFKVIQVCFVMCMLFSAVTGFRGGDYTFELEESDKTCFSEIFSENVKLLFEYKVLKGGNNDVDVRVVSPSGKVVYKMVKSKGDLVTMEPTDGEWKYCFSNEFSTMSHKTIFFSLRPFLPGSLSAEAGGKQVPTVKVQAEMSMDGIHLMLSHVKEFQTRYRLREAIGRHIAEVLNKRVMWWSVSQAIIVMLTGFGQVMIFKTFFTDYRKTTKPEEAVPEKRT